MFSFTLFPQGEEETFPDNELNIQIQNAPNRTITFEMIPTGMNWAKTSGCEFLMYDDQTTYISSLTAGSPGYIDCSYNGFEYRFYNEGNYTTVDNCAQSTAGLKPLRNGFYRINIKENNQLKTYAYFDWRDRGFTIANCNTCSGNDMTIRYDGDDEELWFWNSGGVKINNQEPNFVLGNGQLITWSEMKCNTPNTAGFEDYWDHALVMTNNGNNKPRIVWGPYPDNSLTIDNYRVYRKYGGSAWQLYASVSATTHNYTDEDLNLAQSGFEIGVTVQYRVTAVYNSTQETPFSNTVSAYIKGQEIEKSGNYGPVNRITEYELMQNHPNPFNPTTLISYSIQDFGLVTLKVYDILGNELAVLVNSTKEPGNYEVNFDASNLPSGVYIYTLQVNGFMDSKKMLILR